MDAWNAIKWTIIGKASVDSPKYTEVTVSGVYTIHKEEGWTVPFGSYKGFESWSRGLGHFIWQTLENQYVVDVSHKAPATSSSSASDEHTIIVRITRRV